MRPASASASVHNVRFAQATINFFERFMPDPFVLGILVTMVIAAVTLAFVPGVTVAQLVKGWHNGLFDILLFEFQIILVLVTSHAFSYAPIVQRILKMCVSVARTPAEAAVVTFILVGIASFWNWGLGLVAGAVFAREIARRMRIDYAWLVAAGYSGWVVWGSGISGSIVLSVSTPGSSMNIVEKVTVHVLPISATAFAGFNLIPTIVMLCLMPFFIVWLRPRDEDVVVLDTDCYLNEPPPETRKRHSTFAQRVENSWLGTAFIAAAGLGFLWLVLEQKVAFGGINAVIFVLFIGGVILHGSPIAYVEAAKTGARQAASMMVVYPLYGGIMGMMDAAGLSAMISRFFVAISSAHTLPFWSYVCSLILTFFIPSTMAVAMGEQVSDMMQPFWAAPVVAMAGIGVQRVLGFTMMTFLVGLVVYGAGSAFAHLIGFRPFLGDAHNEAISPTTTTEEWSSIGTSLVVGPVEKQESPLNEPAAKPSVGTSFFASRHHVVPAPSTVSCLRLSRGRLRRFIVVQC
jgi:short-chain fatty acids transporter